MNRVRSKIHPVLKHEKTSIFFLEEFNKKIFLQIFPPLFADQKLAAYSKVQKVEFSRITRSLKSPRSFKSPAKLKKIVSCFLQHTFLNSLFAKTNSNEYFTYRLNIPVFS
jgi:hypothetical protein